jgi:hypothetical protein
MRIKGTAFLGFPKVWGVDQEKRMTEYKTRGELPKNGEDVENEAG